MDTHRHSDVDRSRSAQRSEMPALPAHCIADLVDVDLGHARAKRDDGRCGLPEDVQLWDVSVDRVRDTLGGADDGTA